MPVLVLGTVALDTIKTPYGLRKRILGGSASHFSMSARLFNKVSIVACIGEDFPQEHINFLKAKGIDLSALSVEKGKTFYWEGEYRKDFNTAVTLKTELGVLASFKPRLIPSQRKIKDIFLANVDPDIQLSLLRNIDSPGFVALDSMNYWIDSKRKPLLRLFKKVDIFLANDKEALTLSGERGVIKAAKSLRKMGLKMVLIKKGEHGSLFYNGKSFFSLPAYPSDKIIDPTGAGDTFAGGFMGHLSVAKRITDKEIRRAIALGTVAASFNIEGFGLEASSGMCRRALNKRLGSLKKQISF
ncbi:MAG: PfkB family carbohydrate kinase [Candidatus Omnitrophota bacterium]